jgi:hypothetical protein
VIEAQDRVQHVRFGLGTVVETRHAGYEARVNFQGTRLWVPCSSLTLVEKSKVVPSNPRPWQSPAAWEGKPEAGPLKAGPERNRGVAAPPAKAAPKLGAGTIVPARRLRPAAPADTAFRTVIESLRLGVVPDCALREWTVGRDHEFRTVEEWLKTESEGTLLIMGRYGSGKTHLLRYLAAEALESRYAVSVVRVDPGQENSSFPMRFYGSVMREMRVPVEGGASQEAQHALCAAALAGRTATLDGHPFLGPLVERVRANRDRLEDWAGLMGERMKHSFFPTSLDYTTVANLVCNLLSALSHFFAVDLGLAGLLVLVDEVETAELRRHSYNWGRTLNFLRGLSLVANDDEILEEPVAKALDGCYRGANSGLVYSGHHHNMPYFHRFPTHLKVALALTSCKVSGTLLDWRRSLGTVELSDTSILTLTALYDRICNAYERLYGIRIPSRHEQWVLNWLLYPAYQAGSLRGFSKATVELLDFVRYHPGQSVEAVQKHRGF